MCVWFFGGLGVYFVFFSDNLLNCFLFIDNFDIIIEKKKNQNKLKTNLSGISKKKCSIIFRLKLIQIVWKIDLLSSYRIELTCTKYDIYTILTNLTSESTDTPPPHYSTLIRWREQLTFLESICQDPIIPYLAKRTKCKYYKHQISTAREPWFVYKILPSFKSSPWWSRLSILLKFAFSWQLWLIWLPEIDPQPM